MNIGHALVHTWLVNVAHDDRDLQPTSEEQRQLHCHQTGTNDANLGDWPGCSRVRCTHRMLGTLLHEVERIQRCAKLVSHHQVGKGLILSGEGLIARCRLRGSDQVQRTVGRAECPVESGVQLGTCPGDDHVPHSSVRLLAFNGDGSGQDVGGPLDALLNEICGFKYGIGEAQSLGICGGHLLVHGLGICQDDFEGVDRPDQVWQDIAASPTGN